MKKKLLYFKIMVFTASIITQGSEQRPPTYNDFLDSHRRKFNDSLAARLSGKSSPIRDYNDSLASRLPQTQQNASQSYHTKK